VIVLLAIALATSAGKGKTTSNVKGHRGSGAVHSQLERSPSRLAHTPSSTQVALSLQPTAPVYVCLMADGNRKLIPGVIIHPGYAPVTFHAARFDITLGNNAVTLFVNGKPSSVPASSRAIGYSITNAGRRALAPGRLPTCA
jgi:hypothetical protein